MSIDLDTLVAEYVKRRDAIDAEKKAYEARVAEIKTELDLIGNAIHKVLNDQGLKSARTPHGTAYTSEVTSAKVEDADAFFAYVREHDAFHLLEKRVNKTALLETGKAVPGVTLNTVTNLNVRRS